MIENKSRMDEWMDEWLSKSFFGVWKYQHFKGVICKLGKVTEISAILK